MDFWKIVRTLLRAEPLPPPSLKIPEERKPKKRGSASAAFLGAYRRNAMNFLPGNVVHDIYRERDTRKGCEAAAANWLEADPARLKAAKARGYAP